MTSEPIRTAVITESVREGRIGPTVADWFIDLIDEPPANITDHPSQKARNAGCSLKRWHDGGVVFRNCAGRAS